MIRLAVLIVLSWTVLTEASIFSCGGYVRSKVPVDYSKIQIKLFTPEGHLKQEEDVNPQTGYYMMPVYNKGQYSLRVSAPDGWFFEPASIDFKLDGVSDPCSKNEDINFSLTAFSISGVVESGTTGSGPSGLPLILKSNGQEIASTTTAEGGKYSFKAPPGVYEVSTGADTSVCISNGKATVTVKDMPVTVVPALRISGYELEINVKNNGKPVEGVTLILFSTHNPQLPNCKGVSSVPEGILTGVKYSCPIQSSSAAGSTRVQCVPPGDYQLLPEYKSSGLDFQFSPPINQFVMKAEKSKVTVTVAGFSARGKVEVNGKPVVGVAVYKDGKQVATSDNTGSYTLTGLQEGNVQLTAKAEKTEFSTVRTSLKLPTPSIPAITVTGYELCGSVEQTSDSTGSSSSLSVKNKKNGETVTVRAESNGNFCKMLAPGDYVVSPSDTSSTLTPRSVDVNLVKPRNDLRFTHFKTDLESRVDCIGACDSVQLQLIFGDSVVQTVRGTDAFLFKDIGPGKYMVKVIDNDRYCWASASIPVNVERSKPAAINFEQTGFHTNVKLSHAATLKWAHSTKKELSGEVIAPAGKTTICVPVQGVYKLALTSCRNFDKPTMEIQVPSDVIAEATAIDALVKGTVVSKDKAVIKILVRSAAGERTIPVVNSDFAFYEPLTTSGDIILVPQSDTHLFEPVSHVQKFKGDCIDRAVSFSAHKGIFIDGSISPAVEGVQIVAQHVQDKHVKFEAVTNKDGKYRVGPVRRVEDLSISATKEGYAFTAIEGKHGKMTSVRLSKLTVVVSEQGGEGGRLEGVLLSVVGGREYRSNSMIDASGEINFVGLAPGDYFLRPILQEFKFEPTQTTVTVKEGEHQHIELKGKRVAYSAFGRVREMSGSSISDAVVEALSEGCDHHQSEATTGNDGSFRIRGLKPNCAYRVSLKSGPDGSAAPHCFPALFNVKMTAEHVKDLEMVAAPLDEGFELLVSVDMSGMAVMPQSVLLTLYKDQEILSQQSLVYPIHLFALSNLTRDGSAYSVRVQPDKPPQMFAAQEVSFVADRPVRTLTIPISTSKKQSEIELSFGSLMSLPFFGLLALAFFNQQKTLEIISSLIGMARGAAPGSPSQRTKKRN